MNDTIVKLVILTFDRFEIYACLQDYGDKYYLPNIVYNGDGENCARQLWGEITKCDLRWCPPIKKQTFYESDYLSLVYELLSEKFPVTSDYVWVPISKLDKERISNNNLNIVKRVAQL